MPTFEVSKEYFWAGAHYLRDYNGPCERMHGHNWKVRVYVRCNKRDEQGLVVDFKHLERELLTIRNRLDHQVVNEVPPFDERNPCAENLALYFMEELGKIFDTERTWVSRVMIWETDYSIATVTSDRVQ